MKKLFLACLLLTLTGCNTFMSWQKDNPDCFAEEAVEDLIENTTGYDIDLTPVTGKEKQKLN